ncbi:MAG: hypothetical protein B7Z15_00510, partial [Rhizobiales bacterium 32-66-8]
ENTFKGGANEGVGRIKEAAGAITGSGSLKAEGMVDQVAGKAQRAMGNAADMAREQGEAAEHYVQERPIPALLTAGLIGFAVGYLVAR